MNNPEKYKVNVSTLYTGSEWINKASIEAAPIWCNIDFSNGINFSSQMMTEYEKEEYFKLLCKIGFKEILIGSPYGNESEKLFINNLIQKNLIPDDVTPVVSSPAKKEAVIETLNAVSDIKKAIIKIEDSLFLHIDDDDFVARVKSTLEAVSILKIAADKSPNEFIIEYSPENFQSSSSEDVVNICNNVTDIVSPSDCSKMIINLVSTSEKVMPHIFASKVEYINKNLSTRENIILSVQTHNDKGGAVCSTELSLLAGAQRIEGTLFGSGERTGNADIVTLALNLYSYGVDPLLDFSNMPYICENYERLTGISIYSKMPYSGSSAFAEFSASHQHNIAESIKKAEENPGRKWNNPFLVIDPLDIGKDYNSYVMKINNLSGKSGIGYILSKKYGLQLPAKMKVDFAKIIKSVSDNEGKELKSEALYRLFIEKYVENTPVFTCPGCVFVQDDNIKAETSIKLCTGTVFNIKSEGNGRLDAVSNAFKKYFGVEFDIDIYEEHALTTGSKSNAVSYVCIKYENSSFWGAGIDRDIIKSSVNALTVAVNHLKKVKEFSVDTDPRLIEMLDFIYDNYETVTLTDVANHFFLSKQYVSKYIKEKSGVTFCENVQKIRMKKAEELLKTTNMTVETIAGKSGYPSVEHFNRKFRKIHGLTPVQFRKTK